MFKVKRIDRSKTYKKQETIKRVLFTVDPKLHFMWRDTEKMIESHYPLKNIIHILRKKYHIDRI